MAEDFSSKRGSTDGVIAPNPSDFSHLNFNNRAAEQVLANLNTGGSMNFLQGDFANQTAGERKATLAALTSKDGAEVLASNGFAPAKVEKDANGQVKALEFTRSQSAGGQQQDVHIGLAPPADVTQGDISDKGFQQIMAATDKYVHTDFKSQTAAAQSAEGIRDVLAKEGPEAQAKTIATLGSPEGQAALAQHGLKFNIPQADANGKPTWFEMDDATTGNAKLRLSIPDAGAYSAQWSAAQTRSMVQLSTPVEVVIASDSLPSDGTTYRSASTQGGRGTGGGRGVSGIVAGSDQVGTLHVDPSNGELVIPGYGEEGGHSGGVGHGGGSRK